MKFTNKTSKIKQGLVSAATGISLFTAGAMPVFADGLTDQIDKIIKYCGGVLNTIFPTLCVLMFAFCIVKVLLANQKSAENAYGHMKRIAVCFVAFNCLGLILQVVTGLVAGNGYTWG